MSNKENLDYYDRKASDLARSYDSLNTPDVLGAFCDAVKKLPPKKDRRFALDIGCGSGRDSVWLAEQGFVVTGLDGSPKMLDEARQNQPHRNVKYLLDKAPDLKNLLSQKEKYNVVLMSAFIFHFDQAARKKIFEVLEHVCAEDCLFYISVRSPENSAGRKFYAVGRQEVKDFAAKGEFKFEELPQLEDKLARNAVTWKHYLLRR